MKAFFRAILPVWDALSIEPAWDVLYTKHGRPGQDQKS